MVKKFSSVKSWGFNPSTNLVLLNTSPTRVSSFFQKFTPPTPGDCEGSLSGGVKSVGDGLFRRTGISGVNRR